jgi:hypothetical protein
MILLDSRTLPFYLSRVMPARRMPSASSYYYYATRTTGRVRSRMR